MALSNPFRAFCLLAVPALAVLVAPAAAQNPPGQRPVAGAQPAAPGQLPGMSAHEPTRLANLGPARPDEHPLMPALRWAYDGLGNIEKIQDYSATMVKRERIGDKVGEQEYMYVKVRHEPFSVYMSFLAPAEKKGREVIYIEGANSGKLLAHATGVQRVLGTLELAPTGVIAMDGERYPITEMGVLNMVRKLVEVGEKDVKYGECEVQFFKGTTVNNRVCTCIQVMHPVPRRNFLFHLARIFIDDELNVPIRYEAYDWPKEPGAKLNPNVDLLEEYTYLNLKLNNGFTDADFDAKNPNYDFP